MKLEITVPEVMDLIKEIQQRPEDLFEMIRVSVKENVGHYLSELMDMELTDFLGRGRTNAVKEKVIIAMAPVAVISPLRV